MAATSMDSSCFLKHALLLLLCIVLVAPLAPAQGPAPAPLDCTSALLPLLPCLDFVQGNASTPPKNCCDALASVVASTPICLCSLFSPSNPYGITVNLTNALMLPTLCKVTTPPPSECAAVGYPIPSPTTPMMPSSAASPVSPSPTSSTSPVPSSSTPAPSSGPTSSSSPASSSSPVPPPATPSPSGAVGLTISAAICLLLGTLQIITLDLMQ